MTSSNHRPTYTLHTAGEVVRLVQLYATPHQCVYYNTSDEG